MQRIVGISSATFGTFALGLQLGRSEARDIRQLYEAISLRDPKTRKPEAISLRDPKTRKPEAISLRDPKTKTRSDIASQKK